MQFARIIRVNPKIMRSSCIGFKQISIAREVVIVPSKRVATVVDCSPIPSPVDAKSAIPSFYAYNDIVKFSMVISSITI